ncbi:Polyketide synthase PksJ [Trametes pubescens]|uniref:Polyketide synthase PksJ n=1 Tax=Trametes pubescens TaxID=154538 RepID=A0A1M2VJG5_TRAPU|nr:Polyketide synthase PksJ [Trametes pubescens]
MSPPFSTLPALLASRSQESDVGVRFLDHNGDVSKELSYASLYKDALDGSRRLQSLCSSLKNTDVDVVIASFADHEQHVRLFWACCFAGIPVCPIPPLHPDPSRQAAFLGHLQTLYRNPIMVTDDPVTIERVKNVTPGLQTVPWTDFLSQPLSGTEAAAEISPDTIVCLMLTSGSTGNSKAVALRHSNLLSSIYGKIKHHETTSQSRFLNWIAFDHVACVSEVHLQALAANAIQYHVSPSAIIHRPFNLLEWTSRFGITYSFSPNFLIAQLCRDQTVATTPAGALDLSALVAFISGGEAVPLKTAIEFANLLERFGAPRNALRAGFGMSETGAGCIYDTNPIPRDESGVTAKYLSLGLCCDGVNVRVVSRETGEPCPALEPGLLQLKGPSVFREYYNNPQATAESFTADGWFTTGDGALLDRDGNMHIVGREKDQININGVKHPTVDAEHFIEIGDIDGVTRSTVMVCPMRAPGGDTETYAVFYLHRTVAVEGELNEEDVAGLYATNRAIRDRCIVFCSQGPYTVLPLPKKCFTRTTLGKVSRAVLLTGYLANEHRALEERLQSVSASGPPLTEWEVKVASVVAQLLDVDTSGMFRSSSLFDLGMSSMHLVQLKYLLQEALNIPDIPVIDMLRHPELGQLCDYLEEAVNASKNGTAVSRYNPVICLNPHGHKRPVFLVHPGVGEVLVFMGLAHTIHDRPIYALRARGFDHAEEPFATFDEMVETYVDAIVRQDPEGPYYVGGYSFGGAVAFEMAKVLEARGRKVAWVGIFNLPPFIQSRMHELRWIEVLLNLFMFVALVTPSGLDAAREMTLKQFPVLTHQDTEPANSLEVIDWLLAHSDQARLAELQLRAYELQRWLVVAYQLTCLGRTYLPVSTVRGALMTVFCAVPLPSMGTRESYKANRLAPWKDFCEGDFELVDVDGEHYTMISDTHVHSFAKNLTAAVDRATARLL